MTNKQNAIGVIVGRFQVHKLTEGHKEIVQKRPLDMSKASKKGRLSLILNEINKY